MNEPVERRLRTIDFWLDEARTEYRDACMNASLNACREVAYHAAQLQAELVEAGAKP
jgi:hypothetical protein